MNQGILTLLGSGEFTILMKEIDKYLLSKTNNPKIAILPTAAGAEPVFDEWIKKGEQYYQKLGYEAHGFQIKNAFDTNNVEMCAQLEEFNYFVFSGGDPGYLLNAVQDSLVWAVISNKYINGATVIWSSAGAMVMGTKVWNSIYEFDKKGVIKPWVNGLKLVDFGILPHFDAIPNYFTSEKLVEMKNNLPMDIPIVGIDEDTAYINEGANWMKMGKADVIKSVHEYYENRKIKY